MLRRGQAVRETLFSDYLHHHGYVSDLVDGLVSRAAIAPTSTSSPCFINSRPSSSAALTQASGRNALAWAIRAAGAEDVCELLNYGAALVTAARLLQRRAPKSHSGVAVSQ